MQPDNNQSGTTADNGFIENSLVTAAGFIAAGAAVIASKLGVDLTAEEACTVILAVIAGARVFQGVRRRTRNN